MLRLIQPIAGPDKVVGGGEVVGGIRNDATPSIVARTRFQSAHQAQLQSVAAVLFQHADTAKISCVVVVRGRNDAGKADRHCLVKGEPPMSLIECRNGSAVKECQAVKVSEGICDFFVMTVDFAYPVHRPDFQIPCNCADFPSGPEGSPVAQTSPAKRNRNPIAVPDKVSVAMTVNGVETTLEVAPWTTTGIRVRDPPITLDKLQR
jgi:hypothetical protein